MRPSDVSLAQPRARRRKGLCAAIFTIPNDFEEDASKRRNALSDGAIDAHLPSLTRLGKTLTMAKYVAVLCAVVALTTVLALRESRLVFEEFPKTTAEVAELKTRHPNTRCECTAASFPQKDFSTPVVDVVSACDWVKQDLAKQGVTDEFGGATSGCGTEFLVPCTFVHDACQRANGTLGWVRKGYEEHIFTSTELLEEAAVRARLEAYLDANLEIGSLITKSPQAVLEAWAQMNMPKLVDMTGDTAQRVKLLTTLLNGANTRVGELQLAVAELQGGLSAAAAAAGGAFTATATVTAIPADIAVEWAAFKARCAALTAPGETITKPDGSTFTATAPCDPEVDMPETDDDDNDADYKCFTESCLWGGWVDRHTRKITEIYNSPWNETRVSAFDLYDVKYPYRMHTLDPLGLGSNDYVKGSWLDAENDLYVIPESRRDCTATASWLLSEKFPVASLYTRDVRFLVEKLYTYVTKSVPNLSFRPANRGGCDQYSLMLDTNYFETDSPTTALAFFDGVEADIAGMIEQVEGGDTSILNSGVTAAAFLGAAEPMRRQVALGKEFVLQGLDGLHYSSSGAELYTSIREAIENNFVNTTRVDLRYEEYFSKCNVKSCTHLVDARMSSSALFSILLGIIGGFWSVIELLTSSLYVTGRWFILRSETQRDDEDEYAYRVDDDKSQSNRLPQLPHSVVA